MAASEEVKIRIVAGEPVLFQPSQREADRTIPAEWIEAASRTGVRIEIRNALVTGSLDLKYETIREVVSFTNCRFIQRIDFSYSVFERFLDFSDSTFEQGIIFKGSLLKRDISLDRIKVDAGDVNFTDIQICGLFSAKEASFGAQVTVTFSRARFEKTVQFQKARFMCKAVFSDIVIGPEAVFGGVIFEEEADFGRAQFLGEALFRGDSAGGLQSAIFKKRADFTAAQFGGHAAFDGVTFNDTAIFNGVKFRGAALFRSNPDRKLAHSTFEKAADFTAIEVASYADFTDAQFRGEALFSGAKVEGGLIFKSANFAKGSVAHFYGARVQQQSYFEDAVFEDRADFREIQFGASTFFCGSVFNEIAQFESANFAGLADFSARHHGVTKNKKKGAVFHDVNFDYARFEGDARLEDVEFLGSVSLRETSFRALKLSPTGSVVTGQQQFRDRVELGGCTYDRIEVDWRALLKRLPSASHPDRYDRQPYVQLENVLRASGSDEEADAVYLERRRVERRRKKGSPKPGTCSGGGWHTTGSVPTDC